MVIKNQRSPDYLGNRVSCWSGDQDGSDFTKPEIGAIKKKKNQNRQRAPNSQSESLHIYVLTCKPSQMEEMEQAGDPDHAQETRNHVSMV